MRIIVAVSRWLRAVSAAVLTFLFCVTVLDVIMRIFWKPLTGVYELVSMSGAIVIVFALPLSMLDSAHVYMDPPLTSTRASVARNGDDYKDDGSRLFYILGVALFVLADDSGHRASYS